MAGKNCEQLYVKFFAKSLEIADTVAMIMPTTDRKVAKKHNELLRKKANVIEFIDDKVFPTVVMDMWYVIVDGSGRKPSVKIGLDTNMNSIRWTKGLIHMRYYKNKTGDHGTEEPTSDDDIIIYHKLNGSGLVKKYGKREYVNRKKMFPNTGYAVLLPQTFADSGWSAVEIVKCNGNQSAFHGMAIIFTDTIEQANALVEYMNTDHFIKQANNVKQGFNSMTLSCFKAITIPKEIENIVNGE